MIKKAQVARYRIELASISKPMADTLKKASRKHSKALPLSEVDGRTASALVSGKRRAAKIKRMTNAATGKKEPHLVLTEKGLALRKAL